jgi:predicted RNase H-like HicB family nuclease
MIRYPIFIEQGAETAAFGVIAPDRPGCFSAGDTLDQAVKAAAALWIDDASAWTPWRPARAKAAGRSFPT